MEGVRTREQRRLGAELDELLQAFEAERLAGTAPPTSTCDALAPSTRGVLWIGLSPTDRGGAWRFVAKDGSVRVDHTLALEGEAAADGDAPLLSGLDDLLAGSEEVRVVAAGASVDVDVHALSWRGRALAESLPVLYSLDLPVHAGTRTTRVGSVAGVRGLGSAGAIPEGEEGEQGEKGEEGEKGGAGAAALVVGDPGMDLKVAAAEARSVSTILKRRGWTTITLEGLEATPTRLLDELATSSWFHFAGHAVATDDGWGGNLELANGQRVRASDLSLLSRVPAVAILAACEAASVRSDRQSGGLSVATGLLLRGSDAVLAPVQKVGDAAARTFVVALYASMEAGASLKDAFGHALKRTRDTHPGDDWRAFRLSVR